MIYLFGDRLKWMSPPISFELITNQNSIIIISLMQIEDT